MRNTARRTAAAAAAAVALIIAAAAGSGFLPPHGRQQAPGPGNRGWPLFGGDADNTRFSPLDQINTATAGRLRIAWTRAGGFGHVTWESFPVVVGGRMYVTTNTNAVWALNAATGAVQWTYTPRVDFSFAASEQGSYFPANRGVAVAGGRVYELTFDCHLLALDAATGRPLWQVSVADPRNGYYETTAPAIWGGLVFAGSSGGDSGVRGFVAAYDGRTGRQVWRRYTVPAPGHGWVPRGGHHGGGAVWMPPTVDASTGILYAGTGNPSPDFSGAMRPGADPYTDGIIALRARTGQMLWFTSLVRHDVRDYDAASPVVLLRVRRNGVGARAVGEAGKSGRYYLLDAGTGQPLFAPVPFVPVRTPPPTRAGSVQCPGELGGSNYAPVAYSPRTHAAYVSAIRERPMPAPMLGGATATAGGLVFAGGANGILYGFDSRSGQIRWQRSLGAGFGSAPVVYAIGGREYLAVVSGGAAISAINQLGPVGARLVVFTLS